ncbi:MAG: dihydrodipicolinate reductase [Verrucomicrobia bacterium]|nr:dihydrodipicolinate reductase [Verrucomicrobiota bacterium]MBS0646318.1 dihydrodipicolinate reductase [Verrucomicrobiota bacterium]
MHIGIIGCGKMGQRVNALAQKQGHSVSMFGRSDPLTQDPDIFIDFSQAEAVLGRLQELAHLQRSVVIGTTGWEAHLEQAQHIVNTHSMAALYSPNFSLGVIHFMQLVAYAKKLYPEYACAGLEIHHSHKKDSPSGTARLMSERYGIKFSSVRLGQNFGTYQIFLESPYDQITLCHTATSRESYAHGALQAALWLYSQQGWKTLDDYLHSSYHTV